MNKRSLLLALAASVLASAAHAGLPEGSFNGSSPLLHGPDVMAMLIRKDPQNPTASYAVLAEYTRLPFIPGPERLEIARWVPRVYAYRVETIGKLTYSMKILRVSPQGGIETDPGAAASVLTLAKADSLDGAVLERYENGSATFVERISFKGKVSSTWEKWVPGNFFCSHDVTGGDYLKKDINTTLSKDQVAEMYSQDIVGKFDAAEKAPGLFVFTTKGAVQKGADKVVTRIGVFIDIVNWKPFFTTNELLLINPDDAKDVGFYYQRH
jgi:hypothetical protein